MLSIKQSLVFYIPLQIKMLLVLPEDYFKTHREDPELRAPYTHYLMWRDVQDGPPQQRGLLGNVFQRPQQDFAKDEGPYDQEIGKTEHGA